MNSSTSYGYGLLGLGAVSDYDYLTVGGAQYSAGALLGKELIVKRDVWLYPSLSKDDGRILIKAGQSAGKVSTYLLPGGSNSTGKVVLGFDRKRPDTGQIWTYWIKDDNAANLSKLKTQGTLTVEEQIKREEEEKMKEENQLEYYIKKYAIKALLIGAGVYVAVELGKQLIKTKLSSPSAA